MHSCFTSGFRKLQSVVASQLQAGFDVGWEGGDSRAATGPHRSGAELSNWGAIAAQIHFVLYAGAPIHRQNLGQQKSDCTKCHRLLGNLKKIHAPQKAYLIRAGARGSTFVETMASSLLGG